ncbi:predicted protein [Postia placenta Mad-698-R]|uniref:tRNA (guanine(37)-N1)-methyltransferase n=1 Tax=Postia placenta MAD-698-R-SB12 TaxID=670580 RepID=A0A1X6NEQ3_9APHY|nr:hypothetical protein POSPLADRAFT_1129863 [Postia placenta MAD-698-R-SB12]EED82762.1 predicted protein [Postia placenta Mad-698-R]OSX67101.1 hypothetical protein POSPLADRAFT_1129863 [Postia placenta MAD-698-R-SB12]
MARGLSIDISPPVHRGMKELDKSAFCTSVTVLAAKVPPAKAGKLLAANELKTLVLLGCQEQGASLSSLSRSGRPGELPPEAQEYLKQESAEIVPHKLDLDYDYWIADDILASILPEELVEEAPSGFASVGHIAHLNLKAEYLPYKHIIGQVILDKNAGHIRSVVNKTSTIDTKYRVFKMELLAGESDFIVCHHEQNCQFTFDFSEVYWNSRLHTEHGRLVDSFKPEGVVADVFAGVGPFAIPAAKRGCGVFANDLNPASYKYLKQNVKDNKVAELVRPFCEDGRSFIRSVFNRAFDGPFRDPPPKKNSAQLRQERRKNSPPPAPRRRRITQFAMNLPESAIEFLDEFRGVLASANGGERALSGLYGAEDSEAMPMIHCYCFTRELEPEKAEIDIRQVRSIPFLTIVGVANAGTSAICCHREWRTSWDIRSGRRHHTTGCEMYCISFRLPHAVAFAA